MATGAVRQARRRAWPGRFLALAALAGSFAIPAAFTRLDERRVETHAVPTRGMLRTYHLHVPPGVAGPAPLVVVMHGFLQSWRSARRLTGFEELADAEGFLVAWPEGYRWSWNDGDGRKPASRRGADDLGFLRAVVEDAARRHDVDPERVYAVGFSNSAFLLALRGCELADLFAAYALVAGGAASGWPASCPGVRPIPAVFVNGTEDPALAPLAGVEPGPLHSAEAWAARNGCDSGRTLRDSLPDVADDGTRVARTVHGCGGGAEVLDYRVEGGGHAWPGGPQYLPGFLIGRTSRDFDATRAIWTFLRARRSGDLSRRRRSR